MNRGKWKWVADLSLRKKKKSKLWLTGDYPQQYSDFTVLASGLPVKLSKDDDQADICRIQEEIK